MRRGQGRLSWRASWDRRRGFGNGGNRTKRVLWGRRELRKRVGVLGIVRWLLLERDLISRACRGGAGERGGGRRSGSRRGRSHGGARGLHSGIASPTPLMIASARG